jgi:hypothetical protein
MQSIPARSRLSKSQGSLSRYEAQPAGCDICLTSVATTTVADYIRVCPSCAAKIELGLTRYRERQGK